MKPCYTLDVLRLRGVIQGLTYAKSCEFTPRTYGRKVIPLIFLGPFSDQLANINHW